MQWGEKLRVPLKHAVQQTVCLFHENTHVMCVREKRERKSAAGTSVPIPQKMSCEASQIFNFHVKYFTNEKYFISVDFYLKMDGY